MGPSVSLKLHHPGIFDADLFSQELDLLLEPVTFGLPPEMRVHAVRGPALGQGQGSPGKGNDLDDCRADAAGPASGQGKRMELRGVGHDQPPEGIQG
jgi:hypothetical protein